MSELQTMLNYSQKQAHKMKKFSEILKKHFGIENFWYSKTTQEGKHSSLEANCDNQELFFGSKVHFHYPLVIDHLNAQTGYFLYSSIDNHLFRESLSVNEKKFGFSPTLGIVNRVQGELIRMGFSVSIKHFKRDTQRLINNIQLLEHFKKYFTEEMASVLKNLHTHYYDIHKDFGEVPQKQLQTNLSTHEEETNPLCSSNAKSNFLEALHGLKKGTLTSLSYRETEVMKHLQMLLTISHIGLKMDISSRTAEHYIENIKIKLNCESKSDLIKYAQLMEKCGLFNDWPL